MATHKGKVATIQQLDLADLCIYITQHYIEDKQAVDGAVFAHVAKCLIAAEVQPGGPYKDASGVPTVRVNVAVGSMFLCMNKPLPQVDAFIKGLDPTTLHPDDRQAVMQYLRTIKKPSRKKAKSPLATPYQLAKAAFQQMGEPLQSQALTFVDRVAAADTTREIASIAQFTAQTFTGTIPLARLHTLGEANVYAWVAYTIYDHLIDGDAAPMLLPVANVAMRLALARYKKVFPANHPFQATIDHYFDDMDQANAWELAHCRCPVTRKTIRIGALPDYGQYDVLAQRSGAHILGPLIVARLAEPTANVHQKHFTTGLRHYLIARQLCDDLHDWKADLTKGRISPVVTLLLQNTAITPGNYAMPMLTNKLQHEFLHRTMTTVCQEITNHTQQATQALHLAGCKPSSKLQGLIDRLQKIADASLTEQERFLEFSRSYSVQK